MTNKPDDSVRQAAERLRRCKTEAPIDVYCPKEPSQAWTAEAHKVLTALREADEKALAVWASQHTDLAADSEDLIDLMWMALRFDEVGNLRNQRQFVIRHPVCVFAIACEGPKCWNLSLWCGDQLVKNNPTRGDIRLLCQSLRIPLNGELK